MSEDPARVDDPPQIDVMTLGQAAAAQIGAAAWELDPIDEAALVEPITTLDETEPSPLILPFRADPEKLTPVEKVAPPTTTQVIEAMLFVGGSPLTADMAASAIRGLSTDAFNAAIAELNQMYKRQRRPYSIQMHENGFILSILPAFRGLRQKLFGGPREARLNQPTLDVLSLVAYRQPIGRSEIDAIRGSDSGIIIRQLLRLGLVAVRQRGEMGGEVKYGTTARFLQVFGLLSLEDLPRLGETQPSRIQGKSEGK